MKSFCKNKNPGSFLAIFAFVTIAGFLFFGNAEKSYAAGNCSFRPKGSSDTKATVVRAENEEACKKLYEQNGDPADAMGYYWASDKQAAKSTLEVLTTKLDSESGSGGGVQSCSYIMNPISCPLVDILRVDGWLLEASGSLFGWIVDVNVFKSIVDNGVIYQVWQKVRDLLNIAFILVLLYSAFCTILQIEKYSYKKLLLTLVIMALLVNFSFPITRFIIDTSNVLMYTLTKGLITNADAGLYSKFSHDSQLHTILGLGADESVSSLITAVVFVFILAITLLATSVLFIIRMVVLVIIIIFSPLAFVGSILPDASGYTSKWWDNLFRYSFFGPIMIFMLYVASTLMDASLKASSSLLNQAQQNSNQPNFVASLAFFSVPIVILWIGMGVAQSMSIAGAATVMGGAQKFIKGAGKKFSGFNAIKKQYTDYKKERDARKEEARWKPGKKLGEKANDVQDSIYAQLGSTKAQKRLDKRRTEKNNKDINDGAEELIKGGATGETIINGAGVNFGKATDKPGKVNDAKQARAYMKMDFNDRRNSVEDKAKDILNGGSSAEINNVINIDAADIGLTGAAATRHATDQAAASSLIVEASMRNLTPDEINQINRFINSQMAAAVRKGSTAS